MRAGAGLLRQTGCDTSPGGGDQCQRGHGAAVVFGAGRGCQNGHGAGRGTGARLASALRGWPHLRFEITEEPSAGADGSRWSHTPGLGIFHATTDVSGNIMVSEDRIRYAYESGDGDPTVLIHELSLALGEAWDEELEPFRRAAGVESLYEGSGLGLALAKRIVRRHGGVISAERNEGPGSTFTVTLPRAWKGAFRYGSCFKYSEGSGMGAPGVKCPKRYRF